MASVHCPRLKKSVPMEQCLICKYIRRDDDVSNIWCRYGIGRDPAIFDQSDKLLRQIEAKSSLRIGNIGWGIPILEIS